MYGVRVGDGRFTANLPVTILTMCDEFYKLCTRVLTRVLSRFCPIPTEDKFNDFYQQGFFLLANLIENLHSNLFYLKEHENNKNKHFAGYNIINLI